MGEFKNGGAEGWQNAIPNENPENKIPAVDELNTRRGKLMNEISQSFPSCYHLLARYFNLLLVKDRYSFYPTKAARSQLLRIQKDPNRRTFANSKNLKKYIIKQFSDQRSKNAELLLTIFNDLEKMAEEYNQLS